MASSRSDRTPHVSASSNVPREESHLSRKRRSGYLLTNYPQSLLQIERFKTNSAGVGRREYTEIVSLVPGMYPCLGLNVTAGLSHCLASGSQQGRGIRHCIPLKKQWKCRFKTAIYLGWSWDIICITTFIPSICNVFGSHTLTVSCAFVLWWQNTICIG